MIYDVIKKIFILSLIILFYNKNNYFKLNFRSENKFFYKEQYDFLNKFLKLKRYPSESNSFLIIKEKKNILNFISKMMGKKIIKIKKIFYTSFMRFGNILVSLNKIIFYCKIIGCSNIILDKKKFFIIKNKINIPNNITISVSDIKFSKKYEMFRGNNKFLTSIFIFKPEIKLNLIRNEVIKNLLKVNTSIDDLYIHIRSGDIFIKVINKYYSQPPLCFYQKILNNYKYKRIYIITANNNNPVISKLLKEYPKINFRKNSILHDISILINAFNIVNSISSFLNIILQFNYKFKFLWDYNIYHVSEKIILYHYDLYKYPNSKFTIFRMEPSLIYKKEMFKWKNNRRQRKIMLKDKCNNYFNIINKGI